MILFRIQIKPAILHLMPDNESAQQIRGEIRSNHPLLAAIADKIQTMDEHKTLKYTLGVEIVSDLLKMHVEVAAKKDYPITICC